MALEAENPFILFAEGKAHMILSTGSKVYGEQDNAYTLDKPLGSGGFGSVFKAHRDNDGLIVAIKTLSGTFESDEAFLSFQKESNQSKLIRSDNVIEYYYIHDGKTRPEYPPYIIMEYASDGTLRDYISNRNQEQFDNNTLRSIYLQLARGMKCISEQLVHRDIKPENILNCNGVFKISDFGLSKISGDSTKTMTFKNWGTRAYIAPEAWLGGNNTIQMDIYSMGIVFYELATLSYPYELPNGHNTTDMMNMHLYNSVKNPSSINPSLSPSIVSIILRMLEKPTQNRFNNWDEIIRALETEPMPEDEMTEIVNRAITKRRFSSKSKRRKRKDSKQKSGIT